jgi:type 1 glutamine amidotransferase
MRAALIAVLICFGLLQIVSAAETNRIKVLIVDGYSNHDWKQTTKLIRGVLEPIGLFDVSVSTAPPTNNAPEWKTWRPNFAAYDVVIQTCNDLNGGPMWPEEVRKSLEAYVGNGGGLYVFHAGNNSFSKWPAYNEMIGLGWRKKDFGWAISIGTNENVIRIPAGEGLDTGHGPQANAVVHNLGSHPIHVGLPKQWLTPHVEIYYYARGPAQNLEVLSYGHDAKTQMNWPMEWTVTYGKGRVYNATFGHVWKGDVQPESMRCAGVQTIFVRALQWLAKRPVDFPVPADFPSGEKLSVRSPVPVRD